LGATEADWRVLGTIYFTSTNYFTLLPPTISLYFHQLFHFTSTNFQHVMSSILTDSHLLFLIGMRALMANELKVSKNAFARLRDTKYLSLIGNIANNSDVKTGAVPSSAPAVATTDPSRRGRGVAKITDAPVATKVIDVVWQAEILAYEGIID
jgi:hypothetical protein